MVLMVPWAVFAAVVAMSVPQRMAAESSMRSATEDLAALHEHHDLFSGADGGLYSLEGCAPDQLGEAGDPVCLAVESVFRDLGAAGVDVASLRGFYADKVDSAEGGDDSGEASLRWSLCAPAADAADPDPGVLDSGVYVALVADWTESGWAVSQVWPEGRRVGGEALESRRLLRSAECPEGMAPIDPGALGRSGRLSG